MVPCMVPYMVPYMGSWAHGAHGPMGPMGSWAHGPLVGIFLIVCLYGLESNLFGITFFCTVVFLFKVFLALLCFCSCPGWINY